MRNHIITTLLLLGLLFACNKGEHSNQYTITDVTKFRIIDSIRIDSQDLKNSKQIQEDYNKSKFEEFQAVLERLNMYSLRELSPDTTGYRLIMVYGWERIWTGDPIALTIFKTANGAMVESIELQIGDSRSIDFNNPVRKQFNYKVSKEHFRKLDSILTEQGFWQAYSFEVNDGWRIFDNTRYFIEVRKQSKYKFLSREYRNYHKDLFLPFLRATNYNDSIVNEIDNYYQNY